MHELWNIVIVFNIESYLRKVKNQMMNHFSINAVNKKPPKSYFMTINPKKSTCETFTDDVKCQIRRRSSMPPKKVEVQF